MILFLAVFPASVLSSGDAVMGIYEGFYTSDDGDYGPLSMKVIALGKKEYVAVIELSDRGMRVEIPGANEENRITFGGSVDLGTDLGGSYYIEATAEGSDLKGKFSGAFAEGTMTLKKVAGRSPNLGANPPQGAVVLFDGSGLDQWTGLNGEIPAWQILSNGVMEVGKGNIITKQSFGDAKVHLEFRTPFMPEARGQARGNSGVYMQGRYEAQVLDSFGMEPKDNECGSIYEIAAPLINACLPPLEWQTYDIEFMAPRFDRDGKKAANAVMSVWLNGVQVHTEVNVPRPTRAFFDEKEVPKAGLMLQDHGNPVQYRNIWVLPMD
jgi:hypothetical protein